MSISNIETGRVTLGFTDIVRQASRTENFWGRVEVGGKSIEYRAHTLPNGDIHIGTYYPV